MFEGCYLELWSVQGRRIQSPRLSKCRASEGASCCTRPVVHQLRLATTTLIPVLSCSVCTQTHLALQMAAEGLLTPSHLVQLLTTRWSSTVNMCSSAASLAPTAVDLMHHSAAAQSSQAGSDMWLRPLLGVYNLLLESIHTVSMCVGAACKPSHRVWHRRKPRSSCLFGAEMPGSCTAAGDTPPAQATSLACPNYLCVCMCDAPPCVCRALQGTRCRSLRARSR